MMELQRVIGLRAREHRGEHSQQTVAQRMQSLGYQIDRSAIARIESGDRKMTVEEFLVLAAALNTTPVDLLTSEDRLEIGRVRVDAETATRWLAGEDPEAFLTLVVHGEAEAFARQSNQSKRWSAQVASEVLADSKLRAEFLDALGKPAERRTFLTSLVMSTAAHRITEKGGRR